MRHSTIALAAACALLATASTSHARPSQLEGCPMVSFWHAAKAPNRTQQAADDSSWITHAHNELKTPARPLTLAEIGERWEMAPAEVRVSLCGDDGKSCGTTLVPTGSDGFGVIHGLAIARTVRGGAAPMFLVHDEVCTDWWKERVSTDCGAVSWKGELVAVIYVIQGDDDDSSLVWQQVFDADSGALLLTSEAVDSYSTTARIAFVGDRVTLEGCGSWTVADLRAGKAPTRAASADAAIDIDIDIDARVAKRIAEGRKATVAGDYDGAVAAFSEAIGLKADALKAWSGRGYARLKAGDAAAALEDFRHLTTHHADAMDTKFRAMVDHNIAQAEKAVAEREAAPAAE